MRERRGGWALGVTLVLAAGCRIERAAPPPEPCQPAQCSVDVAVNTSLAVGTTLTAAECKSVCAAAWCGIEPLGGSPGCMLYQPRTVLCGPTASDCGESFNRPCGPSTCSGCCDRGLCTNAFGSCGGASCIECSGCTAAGCEALTACGGQLEAGPRPSTCADAGNAIDPLVALRVWCPSACYESGAVAQVQCAERLGGACGDAGFEAQCGVDAGPPKLCVASCANARESCDRACTQSSYSECIACSASCGITFARCAKSCPP